MAKRRTDPQPVELEKPVFAVGDVIRFKGGRCFAGKCVIECDPGNACITNIKRGAPHPYHIIHTDAESRVYGWIDEADIEGLPLYRTHTIAEGETLHTIAVLYGTDPDTLMELNGLPSPYHIRVGALIRLPESQE